MKDDIIIDLQQILENHQHSYIAMAWHLIIYLYIFAKQLDDEKNLRATQLSKIYLPREKN